MTAISNIADLLSRAFNIRGAFDIFIQDQTTSIVDVYLSENLKTDITLTADVALFDEVINVSAGHGFTGGGEWIEIYDGERWYQSEVVSVATNAITVSLPSDFAFQMATSVVYRVGVDMNVDGSGGDRIFDFGPRGTQSFDITRALISMASTGAMDGGKFGGLAALTNGVYFRKRNSANATKNLMNAKRNQDFTERSFDQAFGDKAPAGTNSFFVRRTFGGQSKNGVVVRLSAEDNEIVEGIVRDNLSGDVNLSLFRIVVQGHVVED